MELAPADDSPPLISVIITSYNYAHYLNASISSVLGQDFPSFELIVIDNASTDNTDDVVATFARDARLRFIKNATNIGLTPNHNRGLSFARGAYILFLSADDMILPGHLRRCYDYLQAHPGTDVLYTGTLFINAQGEAIGIRSMSGQLPVDYDGGRNEFAQQLSEGCYVPWPSMLIPRRLYDELGPMHDDFIASDYEITVRWAAAGKRFAYLRIPSCAIRLHGPQASGTTYVASGRDIDEYVRILEMYVTPEHYPQLRGYQTAIAGHLRWRAGFYGETSGKSLAPELVARVEAMTALLERIPDGAPADALDGAPLISVVVRIGSVRELVQALDALARQVDAPPFETIVVGEGGPDYSAILRMRPDAEHVRFVRMDGVNAGAARNTGIRLAAGRIVAYLEPGSSFEPWQLANLAAAFAAGASIVRTTNARLYLAESHDGTGDTIFRQTAIAGLYRGDEDSDRDYIAPSIPIDTVAHVRALLQHIGPFRTDWSYGETWEFWLRLRRFPVTTMANEGVRVGLLQSNSVPDGAAFISAVRSVYETYVAPAGSAPTVRRDAFLRDMSRWFEQRSTLLTDQAVTVQFIADLHGIQRATVAI